MAIWAASPALTQCSYKEKKLSLEIAVVKVAGGLVLYWPRMEQCRRSGAL
jgi:hypothetical protein